MTASTNTTTRTVPERTCVGCGAKASARDLVRVVRGPSGEVAVDAAGGAFGRGAHVHAQPDCLERACKGGLSRAFKTHVTIRPDELARAVGDAMDRRIEGLLLAAWRAGVLAVGRDATLEAVRTSGGQVPLVVVARDAGSVAGDREIAGAIAEGRAIAWGDKALLGKLTGRRSARGGVAEDRDESPVVSVAAVTSASIGAEVKCAYARADGCRSLGRPSEARDVPMRANNDESTATEGSKCSSKSRESREVR